MPPGEPPAERASNVAALPRMRASFQLQIMGDMGLSNGDVWWMDPREVLFWCPEALSPDRDMRGRIDLRAGKIIDVHMVLVSGEKPVKHGQGYLHIARWRPEQPTDARVAEVRLREHNPDAFAPTYRPPRLPEVREEKAVAAREPTETELLTQRFAGELEALNGALRRTARRRAPLVATAAVVGFLGGAAGAVAHDDASALRLMIFHQNRAFALDHDWLSGADLPGEDFSGASLTGVNFRGSRLVGASFSAARLAGARFVGADLRRTDFRGADLNGASLVGARLEGASLAGADLRGADVTCAPEDADFTAALYSDDTRWHNGQPARGAVGPGADLSGVALPGFQLASGDLRGIRFRGATLPALKLQGIGLAGADFSEARADGAVLVEADLTQASFERASCADCQWRGARLDGLRAGAASLAGLSLPGTQGDKLDFRGADLGRADLGRTTFTAADLRGASLAGANLADANWTGCLLLGANLERANLAGAHLDGCVADSHTVWPAGAAAWNYGAFELAPQGNAQGAVLPESVDLSGRDLRKLKAPRMTAPAAKWDQALLEGSDLSNANLAKSSFGGAVLKGSNLAGADLSDATFAGADLSGVSFAQARLCGADLADANLAGARFDRATACSSTRWPKNKPPKGITLR